MLSDPLQIKTYVTFQLLPFINSILSAALSNKFLYCFTCPMIRFKRLRSSPIKAFKADQEAIKQNSSSSVDCCCSQIPVILHIPVVNERHMAVEIESAALLCSDSVAYRYCTQTAPPIIIFWTIVCRCKTCTCLVGVVVLADRFGTNLFSGGVVAQT